MPAGRDRHTAGPAGVADASAGPPEPPAEAAERQGSAEPYAGAAEPYAATRETHAGVVFLVGERAYKLKKPVDLGFLDFRTPQDRERACQREIDLNRRLAPDVYLGVAHVHCPGGGAAEPVVVMRRMPHRHRLSTLVREGAELDGQVRALARLLAGFHAAAERGPEISAQGGRDAILGRWRDSFDQTRPYRGGVLDAAVAALIETLTEDFLAGRAPLFDDRIAAGRIVDGHGDLLADDVFCLDDGPRVLDCIEFDDRLRWLDSLDDVAFLAMDLQRLGAAHLGERLLDWYAEFSADPAPASLRHHYLAYRAFVRAKVSCLRSTQGDERAGAEVAGYADLTLRHLRAGEVALVAVGGLPGTGKTTLAAGLADRLGAVLLSSDRVRKELAGLAPERPAAAAYQQGIYTPEWTARTYAELLDRAGRLLERGETTILDASWTRPEHRELAQELAARTRSRWVPLVCQADPHLVAERLAARTASLGGARAESPGGARTDQVSISDADDRIAAAMAVGAPPWPGAPVIRTDRAPDRSVDEAAALARAW